MGVGSRMAIDPRTHQRGMRRVILVNFIYYAAKLLQDRPVQEITSEILYHLETTQEKLETVWGRTEFERFRLSGATIQNLDPVIKETLQNEIGEEDFHQLAESPVDSLPEGIKLKLENLLGRRVQNQILQIRTSSQTRNL